MSTDAFVKYFEYGPGKNILHRLDPGTKIVL